MIFTKTYRSRVMWSCQIILILCSESTARRTDRRGRRSLQYKIPFRHDSCQRSKDFATREAPKMRFVNRNNARGVASALFLWHRRRKEKALQKESAVMGSFAACGRRPKALPSATASLWKGLSQTLKRARGDRPSHLAADIVSGWNPHLSVNKPRVRGAGTARPPGGSLCFKHF